MAELLKVILDNPWNFVATLILMLLIGGIVNVWLQSTFKGMSTRQMIKHLKQRKATKEKSEI